MLSAFSVFFIFVFQDPCLEGQKDVDAGSTDQDAPMDTGANLSLILGRRQVGQSYRNVEELLLFARRLNSLGLLPALMFNFSRHVVTQLCCNLVKALKDAQWSKYYGTPELTLQTKAINKQRMDKYKVRFIWSNRLSFEFCIGVDQTSRNVNKDERPR